MEVLRSALTHWGRCAVLSPPLPGLPHRAAIAGALQSFRYADLITAALQTCRKLEGGSAEASASSSGSGGAGSGSTLDGPRVALFCEPGPSYVAGQFATWLHRGISVPLCLSHPDRELQYVLEDAEVSAVLAGDEAQAEHMHKLAQPLGAQVHLVEAAAAIEQQAAAADEQQQRAAAEREVLQRLRGIGEGAGALIIYTSGTTGRPKGALHTHGSLLAMVDTLRAAWEWRTDDRILHALPLHHVHGIVNALLCALRAGAAAEMLPRFAPGAVWEALQQEADPVTVFMGVPTMYAKLLSAYDAMDPSQQAAAAAAARRLRLAVSGSAACPTPIMQRWEALSGEKQLERYGMTETGMLLGNPYSGERRPGTVGRPFPGVEVRLAHDDGSDAGQGPGELRVRGPQLFREYWRRPEATAAAFDERGFFLTGDTGVLEEGGYVRLLGRTSVDVIKAGGYKISALHIESALLEHPSVDEVAVVGLPDETYGERIAAVVALEPPAAAAGLSLQELRAWARERLPAYELPRELRIVDSIPRNAMGKVNKKELKAALFPAAPAPAPAA